MKDTEDLIIEGLKLLGKTVDAKKAEVVPPTEAEAHEVETSEPWYHPHHLMHHAPTIIVAALGLIGMVVVARINNRRKRRPT